MSMVMDFKRSSLSILGKAPLPIRQELLGLAYALVPRRLPGVLPLIGVTLRDLPAIGSPLVPDPSTALDVPDGLCGLAGAIGVKDLLAGYARGMYVMNHVGPLKWWAPRHRMTLFFDQARIEKTTRRLLRNQRFEITFDTAFAQVLDACAAPRPGHTPLTWITPRIRELFLKAHHEGHAHTFEVWQDGGLVGGGFGLAVGRIFFTESQFHTVRDASKVGFSVLNRHLQTWGFVMNDGKHPTRYLADAGMMPLTRDEFGAIVVRDSADGLPPGRWTVDADLLGDDWQPAEVNGVRMADVLPEGSSCAFSVEALMTTDRSPTW